MTIENKPTCVVCGEAADTIRDGRDYCARHYAGHTPEVPIVFCAVLGCGSPVAPASRWCRHHAPHFERQAA